MGLDDWPIEQGASEISEARLLKAVQHELGPQVARLLTPPVTNEHGECPAGPFDDTANVGVPVAPFPRWQVCPYCRLLAPISRASSSSGSIPTARTGAATSTDLHEKRASRPRSSRPDSWWPASMGTSTTSRGSSSSTGAGPTAVTNYGSTKWGRRARSPTSR